MSTSRDTKVCVYVAGWGGISSARKSTYTAARQKINSNQAVFGHRLIPVLISTGYFTVFNTNWSSLCTVKAHDPRPRVNPNCTDEKNIISSTVATLTVDTQWLIFFASQRVHYHC